MARKIRGYLQGMAVGPGGLSTYPIIRIPSATAKERLPADLVMPEMPRRTSKLKL